MHDIIVILNYVSVFVMMVCLTIIATHESSKMQKMALIVNAMLLICCLGFLIKCEGKTADTLIVGQKLVYATVTHGMFLMLLFIIEYCRFHIPKFIQWIFHFVNLFITTVVLTLDHHSLFYTKYWAETIDGNVYLAKEYGPVHTLAIAVFIIYMAGALLTAIFFSVKNMKKRSRYVWRLLLAVSLPCIAYILPKLLNTENEFQPIAFAAFMVIIISMVYTSNLYDIRDIATQYSVKSMKTGLVVFDEGYVYKGSNDVAYRIIPQLANIEIDSDIKNESAFLKDCLDGIEKEFEADEKIYSISVNPVKNGEKETGRVLWFEDVTYERNYTKLLQQQKESLESRVETLYDISYKDDMTGLNNRRSYEDLISELRGTDDISKLIVAEFDINGLKNANDNIGHKAGDELIIGTADLLSKVFGAYGDVFRTGGDEFFVIIKEGEPDIKALEKEFKKEMSAWKGQFVKELSLSYGFVYAKDNPDMGIDELMIAADKAMYDSKAEYYSVSGHDRRH